VAIGGKKDSKKHGVVEKKRRKNDINRRKKYKSTQFDLDI